MKKKKNDQTGTQAKASCEMRPLLFKVGAIVVERENANQFKLRIEPGTLDLHAELASTAKQ